MNWFSGSGVRLCAPSNRLWAMVWRAGSLAATLLFPLLASASIELSLSHSQCQPGDVIELHAESSFEELVTYELKFPQHDALHLVAHQRQPVIYADGVYSQKDVWVLQPVQSGTVEINGIKAIVQKGDVVSKLDLPKQVIEVLPYTVSSEDFTPEPLPAAAASEQKMSKILILLILGSTLIIVVVLFIIRKPRVEVSEQDSAPTLDDLKTALASGEAPVELVEQLLNDDSIVISDELRVAMERTVYRQDTSALKVTLEQEVAK